VQLSPQEPGPCWPVVRTLVQPRSTRLESTIIGEFDSRRGAELAVEHVVQECGVQRSDVFVQSAGDANTAGTHPAGADVKAAPAPEGHQQLGGLIEVSVDFHGDAPEKIADILRDAGAKTVRTK
jgi:hypothetical protein